LSSVQIPFVKAHGARNDFLLTWRSELPSTLTDLAAAAVAICDRHAGVGADGWYILTPAEPEAHVAIELRNSDGGRAELSGNGTRCVAALLVESGIASNEVRIKTGAGVKRLVLLDRTGPVYSFETNLGPATVEELHWQYGQFDCAILNVGNPQCTVFVSDFDFDWRSLGATLERHPRFPNRTNVSFVRLSDSHSLDVRFFERGAGETMSSGTGSTGAAAAALARGIVSSPVRVVTPAGPLEIEKRGEDLILIGPAEIVASGRFHYHTK
jgi:diaminopimelate epimerase